MAERRLGIILHGATGRMGATQHLRGLLAIRREGGLALANGDVVLPDPILVGRNPDKLRALAAAHDDVVRWTTDLDGALANPDDAIFFDAASSQLRVALARRAIAAGKHVYLEKPIAASLDEALALARAAEAAGLKHGVVQDKLFLPGLQKLRLLKDAGFFGRILALRLDFGWWVFEGDLQPSQRSSWNYRRRDGGGLVLDMFVHWRYIIDRLFGTIESVTCSCATHIPQRWDEAGEPYAVDVEDAAYATMKLAGGIVAQVTNSWCTRVRRDDMITIQVDGTHGSAVATPHRCVTQARDNTPKPIWDVDTPQTMNFFEQWVDVPDNRAYPNSFRSCWEGFIRHVAEDAPFPAPLLEGAKGVQLAEACYRSDRERRWVDLPALAL